MGRLNEGGILFGVNPIELVKCPNCKWVHFLVDDGQGEDNCFFCYWSAKHMVPATQDDCPVGSTLQGVNRSNYDKGIE